MIDLTISGTLDKDVVVFTLNGESKHIDQFSKQAHFYVEATKTNRLYFEQKSEQYIPHSAEIILNILLFPLRGVFNVLTFNTVQSWEKDISAFKLSGYIDITLDEATEITFELKQGKFDRQTNTFYKPTICFFPNVNTVQTCIMDAGEITKKHHSHVLNICSASALLLGILLYLLFAGLQNEMYIACIVTSMFVIFFSILTLSLISHSFKKRFNLISTLDIQETKKQK